MSKIITRSIQTNNRSGTFSCKADYTPLNNGMVEVEELTYDSYGILPSGREFRQLPLAEAQAEYRQRKANGWH